MTAIEMPLLKDVVENQLATASMMLTLEAEKLDQLISSCGQLLDLLQPRQPGRIEVKWWVDAQGPERGRSPYLVELRTSHRKEKAGRWYQKKIGRKNLARRTKTRGEFTETAGFVREVLEALSFLLDRRETLLRLVGTHAMTCKRMVTFHTMKLPDLEWLIHGIVESTAPFTIEDDRVEGAYRLDMDAFLASKLRKLYQAKSDPSHDEPA